MIRLRKYGLFLLLLFVTVNIPDQLIHLLVAHHDTVDAVTDQPAVGNPHIHCAALQYNLDGFIEYLPVVLNPVAIEYPGFEGHYSYYISAIHFDLTAARAPPAIA